MLEGIHSKSAKSFWGGIHKPVYTPFIMSIYLIELNVTQLESEREYMSYVRYASVVGSLMYAMVRTRLELAQTVSEVSRYMGMFSIQLC